MALRKSVFALAVAAVLSVSASHTDAAVVTPPPASSATAAAVASGVFGLVVGFVIWQSMAANQAGATPKPARRPR